MLLTPVATIPENKAILTKLVKVFSDLGHTINSEVLATSENLVQKINDVELMKLNHKIQRELKSSDFVIAEITQASSGIGFLISQAIMERKPTLVIMRNNTSRAPIPIQAKDSKLIYFRRYNDASELEEIAKSFLENVRQYIDRKFILIIPSEIDKYLEWSAYERRKHKSQIVREALETSIGKDSDYQEFLAEEAQTSGN